jgi:hypothetical protein
MKTPAKKVVKKTVRKPVKEPAQLLNLGTGTPGIAALRTPPQGGDTVLNVGVRIEKKGRKAVLSVSDGKFALAQDATGQNGKDFVQPLEDYGLFDCQTCTLIMSSVSGVKATAKGAKVTVSVKRSGKQTILVVK